MDASESKVSKSKAYNAKYYQEHKEQFKIRLKKYNDSERGKAAHKRYQRSKQREQYLKHYYNLTLQQFEEMSQTQDNVCAICKKECTVKKVLSVDHDHKTNQNRGLVCHYCNLLIGYAKDNIHILDQAKAYLEKYLT